MNGAAHDRGTFRFVGMKDGNLATYLRDHLAGSVAGLETVTHLAEAATQPELRTFLETLRAEIEADKRALEEVLKRADFAESGARQAAAWIAEKVAWTKFTLAGTDEAGLGMLEGLEALMLGVTGKRALWKALRLTALEGDFAALEKRAAEQIERLEICRLAAARAAFAADR